MAAPCKCKRMQKLMAAMGAKQAAAMHGNLHGKWTTRQQLVHIKEEEDYIFPVMLHVGMIHEVRKLGTDHNRFRDQVRLSGKINEREWEQHAALEDEYMLRLEPYVFSRKKAA